MTETDAPASDLRLANARDITDTSVLRIGRTDCPVESLYVTPKGHRVLRLRGEQGPRVFFDDDIVTLVVPADSLDVSGEVAQQ